MTTDKALEAARASYRHAEENPRFVECPRCKGVGYHHGFGEEGNDPDWCSQCGGSQQIMPADEADRPLIEAISAYLSALPGEAEVVERLVDELEAIELASRNLNAYLKWQLSPESPGHAPTFPSAVAHFRGQFEDWVFAPGHAHFEQHQKDRRDATLASLQPMQARAEAAERERDTLRAVVSECASALPNGAFVSPQASLEFMAMLPAEIASVCTALKGGAEAAEARVKELEEALAALTNAETVSVHVGYDNGPGGGNYIYADAVRTDGEEFIRARTALKGGSNG